MIIQTGNITQYRDIEADETLQSVPWAIIEGEGDEAVELLTGVQSFPLSATAEEITAFLARRLEVYKEDVVRHESAKTLQEDLDHASVVAEEVSGITINEQ